MSFNRIRKTYITDIPEPVLSKNKISGTINEADTEDRTVWAYDRRDGELLGATIVNRDTRQWELYIDPAHEDESITLICRDESPNYNGDIFDKVSLCMTEYPYPVGIMGLMDYPDATLVKADVNSNFYNHYCNVLVPELKGDIAKVVQTGSQIDKAYPIKFVNSAGNEIVNDVTSNNVVVNDDSVVLNKITRAPNLVTWCKDIFGDGSEFFHPVWDGKMWKNYYGGQPFEVCHYTHPDIDPSCLPGKFYEAAFCVEEKQGMNAHWGPRCNVDTTNVHSMSVSFWYKSTGRTSSTYSGSSTHDATFDIISVRDIINHVGLFRLGTGCERYYVASNQYQNKYYLTGNNVSAANQTVTESGFSFERWNHIVLIYTSTSVDLYINKNLIKTLTFSARQIGDMSSITLGKSKQDSDYSNDQVTGIYSGLRIFKKAISDAEIEQLYNDTPVAETEVHSVKGMEHSDGLICLGGVPYKPLIDLAYAYENVHSDGTKDYILPEWTHPNIGFNVHSDHIEFFGHSYIQGQYTGLSSQPNNSTTSELGFSLDNIDVYMRVFLVDTGYVLKIGNSTASMHFYWYNNDNGMVLRWRYANGSDSNVKYIGVGSRPADIGNKWVRIKWIQDKIYFYEDDGVTLIKEYTIPNYSMYPATQGQISVGTNRGGSRSDTATTDYYGGRCKISDVYIYEKGKMDTDEPIIKYELGYNRGVLGGLYMWSAHTNTFVRNSEGDIQELDNNSYIPNGTIIARDWDNSKLFNGRGFTFVSNVYQKNYSSNYTYFFVDVNNLWGIATSYGMIGHLFRYFTLNCNDLTQNRYFDLKLYASCNYSDGVRQWYNLACTYDQSNNMTYTYAQGFPLNNCACDQLVSPTLNSEKLRLVNNANAQVAFSGLYMYPVVLPPKSIRNAAQNYSGKCYKDEMLVAFIEENTDYPIYANTPLTKINIEGLDNGQVLTFACTKNNTDYYIFTTEWKKILTKEGDFWMYWDGSIWQNGGTVKWKAASLAMDIPANRMSLQKINSLNTVQLNTLHNLNNGTFNLAVGMKSNGTISPYIDRITYNNEKVWLSEVCNLADFEDTEYITKVYLSKVLCEGWTDGIKVFVHNSNELGWIECQNFREVPSIIRNTTNTGTVQFKVTFDQSKDNAKETALLEVTIK